MFLPSPNVSIIINNYNYDAFLHQAIDSALNQSYLNVEVNVEVIVVDDGSDDRSVEIIQGYGDRIIPVLKTNGGQASALNAGFDASSGDLILFLDADDYLFPNAVETIVAQWRERSNCAQVQSRLELVDTQGKHIDLYPAPEIAFDHGDVTALLLSKGRYNTTITSGTGFSRAVLDQILPIPEEEFRISADGYLVTTAPFYGHVLAIETPIGARRKHATNAWAVSDMTRKVEQFRTSFEHDFVRYKYLKRTAKRLGYSPFPKLELSDYLHVQDRLAYLRLDPHRYPITDDSPYALSLRGIWAIVKHSQFTWSRKGLLCIWFLWLGFASRSWVTTSIRWRFFGHSRPSWMDRLLKTVRYSTS